MARDCRDKTSGPYVEMLAEVVGGQTRQTAFSLKKAQNLQDISKLGPEKAVRLFENLFIRDEFCQDCVDKGKKTPIWSINLSQHYSDIPKVILFMRIFCRCTHLASLQN